jgi:hypothetical protein
MLWVHVVTIFFTLKFMRLLDAKQCQIWGDKCSNMINFVWRYVLGSYLLIILVLFCGCHLSTIFAY